MSIGISTGYARHGFSLMVVDTPMGFFLMEIILVVPDMHSMTWFAKRKQHVGIQASSQELFSYR